MIARNWIGGSRVVVPLERAHAILVHRERFVVARFSWSRRRRRRRVRTRSRLWRRLGPVSGQAWPELSPHHGSSAAPWGRPILPAAWPAPAVSPAGFGQPGRGFRCRRLDVLPRRWVTFLLPGLLGHAVLFGPFALARAACGRQPGPRQGNRPDWTGQGNRRGFKRQARLNRLSPPLIRRLFFEQLVHLPRCPRDTSAPGV